MHAAFLFQLNLFYAFRLVFIFPFGLILRKIHEFCLFVLIKFVQLLFIFQREVLSFCDSSLSFRQFFFASLTQFFCIFLLIITNLTRAEQILNFNKLATFIKINLKLNSKFQFKEFHEYFTKFYLYTNLLTKRWRLQVQLYWG